MKHKETKQTTTVSVLSKDTELKKVREERGKGTKSVRLAGLKRRHFNVHHELTRKMFFFYVPTKNATKIANATGQSMENLSEEKRVAPREAAEKLINFSDLKHIRLYPTCERIYMYQPQMGCYKSVGEKDFLLMISEILRGIDPSLFDQHYIANIYAVLKLMSEVSFPGQPETEQEYFSFTNGLLDIRTLELREHTPDVFNVNYLPYEWVPNLPIPGFDKFMHRFTGGDTDKISFLRSVMSIILKSETRFQIFLYLYGPGGTGKSSFTTILEALIGEGATHVTTLKALHNDPFEVANLADKKLVLMNDSEQYSKDVSNLKAMVGNDGLRGRFMHRGATQNIQFNGIAVIVGNKLLNVRDTTNALLRRYRPFLADNVSKEREPMLIKRGGRWSGKLASELPGIMYWGLSAEEDMKIKYIERFEEIPTLAESLIEAKSIVNPLENWIEEELEFSPDGVGSYVGYKPQNERVQRISEDRGLLYPAYIEWCRRNGGLQPLSHKNFSNSVVQILNSRGNQISKERDRKGIMLTHVRLKEDIFTTDYKMGSAPRLTSDQWNTTLQLEQKENLLLGDGEQSKEAIRKETGIVLPTGEPFDVLPKDLYQRYISHLSERTRLRKLGNSIVRSIPWSENVDPLVDQYLEGVKTPSLQYRERVRDVIEKGALKLSRFGGIPYSYKMMGASPRVCPTAYRESVNSVKKVIRRASYKAMAKQFKEEGFVVADLDLKSCYTSILLGLYPNQLVQLHDTVRGPGLWNAIKSEFDVAGVPERFHKPSVKICVYSSLFQGGNKAMTDGILENERKNLGLTQNEFKENREMYDSLYKDAQEVVTQMQNSFAVDEFKHIAGYVLKAYNGDTLQGPTGHTFFINQATFRTAYPNYLQSYEFSLLAGGTLRFLQDNPSCEVIGHYHDGLVLALPTDGYEQTLDRLKHSILNLGKQLKLQYPQEIEVQEIF